MDQIPRAYVEAPRLGAGETMADVARTYAVDATTIGRLAASSPFEQGGAAL